MPSHRTKAVIAVFGGSDHQAIGFAKRIGTVIASKQQILLSGGAGAGEKAVKDSAIDGVGSSAWIGVDRPKCTPLQSTCGKNGNGFVITSHLDHKRNYVEAALCDAAVGLTGGDGTFSEVIFALSLHRPVALVGTHWINAWPLLRQTDQGTPETAAARAMRKVGKVSENQPNLRALLNEGTICAGLSQLSDERVRYFGPENDVDPQNVVDWLLATLGLPDPAQLHGMLPPIEGHESIRSLCEEWLSANAT